MAWFNCATAFRPILNEFFDRMASACREVAEDDRDHLPLTVCVREMRGALIAVAAIALASATIPAQEPRVFDGAPVASWIAPAGVPGDTFIVFHARRTFNLPS